MRSRNVRGLWQPHKAAPLCAAVAAIVLFTVLFVRVGEAFAHAPKKHHPWWQQTTPQLKQDRHHLRWLLKEDRRLAKRVGWPALQIGRQGQRVKNLPGWTVPVYVTAVQSHIRQMRQERKQQEKQRKRHMRTIDYVASDFRRSVAYSADYWNVSEQWILNCAGSEGGVTNRWIWGRSGDLGPLQYLRGTYMGFSRNARNAAKKLGLWLPKRLFWSEENRRLRGRSDTLFGQAFATAWAFRHGLSHHWFGRGC